MLHLILAALEKGGRSVKPAAATRAAGVKGSAVTGDLIKSDLINDLLNALVQDPAATYDDLAARLGVSPATVKRRLADLKKAGTIERVGSKKAGTWKVN